MILVLVRFVNTIASYFRRGATPKITSTSLGNQLPANHTFFALFWDPISWETLPPYLSSPIPWGTEVGQAQSLDGHHVAAHLG